MIACAAGQRRVLALTVAAPAARPGTPPQIDESVFYLVEQGPACAYVGLRDCEVLQGSFVGIQDVKVRRQGGRAAGRRAGEQGQRMGPGRAAAGSERAQAPACSLAPLIPCTPRRPPRAQGPNTRMVLERCTLHVGISLMAGRLDAVGARH